MSDPWNKKFFLLDVTLVCEYSGFKETWTLSYVSKYLVVENVKHISCIFVTYALSLGIFSQLMESYVHLLDVTLVCE